MFDFLLYIDFKKNNFFTLVGGVKSTSLSINKEPIETQDFNRDYRLFIPGSGVFMVHLAGTGLFDNADTSKEMRLRLLSGLKSGNLFKIKLESEDFSVIGEFLLTQFNISQEVGAEQNFNIELKSHDDVVIS